MTEYVIVPQHITGDFSENGCIGEKMEKSIAMKIYGSIIETLEPWEEGFQTRSTCTKACQIKQKHGVVCEYNFLKQNDNIVNVTHTFFDQEDMKDDISDNEEKMGMWGY